MFRCETKKSRGPSAIQLRWQVVVRRLHTSHNFAFAQSGRRLSYDRRLMLQRGALAGSLQCFAKTNVGYEASQQFFNCYAHVDPTRARYLPVPSTAHPALQPIIPNRNFAGVQN